MTAHRVKKDSPMKDILIKMAVRKADPRVEEPAADPSVTLETGASAKNFLAPVTGLFMETLFTKLFEDIVALRDDVAADIKKVRKNVTILTTR
ncbi:hypothetical protein NDU88_002019 [Pleurodeles waltl]|uniref:Uncharacterized protein n=1 Tax=Pleurodeles waltl TaxID=8319 RepID=A0AAV7LN59_PLEWA|nr:hypothetical protein NDU88_002019 [Pleurodeles waltl]